MKCTTCGSEIQNEGKFCSFCGSRVVENVVDVPQSIKKANELYETGISLRDEKKLDEASECFDKAIILEPNRAKYYAELAITLIYKDNLSKAIEVANKSLELDKNLALAYYARGVIQKKLGKLSESLLDLTTAIQKDPSQEKVYIWRGEVQNDLENYEEAIQDFSRSIEVNTNEQAYYGRAISFFELEKYQKAIRDFSKAIEIDPEFDGAFCWRGRCYALLNNNSKAMQDYSTAIQIFPEYTVAYKLRGMLFEKLNKIQNAIQDYEKVVELDSADTVIYDKLYALKGVDTDRKRSTKKVWKTKWGNNTRDGFVHYMEIHPNRVVFYGYQVTDAVLSKSSSQITLLFRNIKDVRKVGHPNLLKGGAFQKEVRRWFASSDNRAIIIETYDKKTYNAGFYSDDLFDDWNEAYRILISRL